MAYEFALPKDAVLRHKPIMGRESVYTIEKVLGQGGFGITYLASSSITILNIEHKIHFAIKEFFVKGQCWREEGSYEMKYSPAAREEVEYCKKDFIDEAKRLYKICSTNSNIVNVNEVFEENDTAYYVMEYLNGGSIRDKVVEAKQPFNFKDALDMFLPVARAVETLHSEFKLLHCDISPDNIILRKGDEGEEIPVLIDFGESHHFNSKGELTTTHNAIGAKEGYAPQEQYRGITIFDPRIDVYALAATLFYMITARKPISAFDISSEYIRKYIPEKAPLNIQMAIIHGMQKDKDNRTPNVITLINELTTTIIEEETLGDEYDYISAKIDEKTKEEKPTLTVKQAEIEQKAETEQNVETKPNVETETMPNLGKTEKFKKKIKEKDKPKPTNTPKKPIGKILGFSAGFLALAAIAYLIATSEPKPDTESDNPTTDIQQEAIEQTTTTPSASDVAISQNEEPKNTQNNSEKAANPAAKKKADQEADNATAAKRKAEQEAATAAAKKKAEQEAAATAAKRKAEQEAAATAAKRKAEQEAAAAAAKRKAEQEAASKRKAEEAAQKKLQEKNSGFDDVDW